MPPPVNGKPQEKKPPQKPSPMGAPGGMGADPGMGGMPPDVMGDMAPDPMMGMGGPPPVGLPPMGGGGMDLAGMMGGGGGGDMASMLGGTPDIGGAAMAQADPVAVLMWLMNRQDQAGAPGMQMGPPDLVPSPVPASGGGDVASMLMAALGGGMGATPPM